MVVGGLISLAVAHIYFWKTKPLEHRLQSIVENMQRVFVRERLPEFFDSLNTLKFELPPIDQSTPDVPQLDLVILDRAVIHPGDSVNMLFKVIDLGFNFRNPDGAEVKYRDQPPLKVENVAFGYLRTSFTARAIDGSEENVLVFKLHDEDEHGRPNRQKEYRFRFRVVA